MSALYDRPIFDRRGEFVGRIREVLFNVGDGRIEYICIALDGSENGRTHEAVVPWSSIRSAPEAATGSRNAWQVAARKSILERLAQPVDKGSH